MNLAVGYPAEPAKPSESNEFGNYQSFARVDGDQNDGGVIAAITTAGASLRFPARCGREASIVMQSPACNTYSSPSTQKCISPWITTICSSPKWVNGASGPSTPGPNSTQMNSI